MPNRSEKLIFLRAIFVIVSLTTMNGATVSAETAVPVEPLPGIVSLPFAFQGSVIVAFISLILLFILFLRFRSLKRTLHNDLLERQRTKKDLEFSEEKFQALMNALTESACLFRYDGTCVAMNDTAIRRLNRTREEVIGRSIDELFPQELVVSRRNSVQQVFETGGPVQFVDERDGILFEHSIYPVSFENDNVTLIATFSRDITEKMKALDALKKSEKQYRTLFENMAQGVYYLDTKGDLLDCNPALLTMFDLSFEEFRKMVSEGFGWKVITEEGQELSVSQYPSREVMRTGVTVSNRIVGVWNQKKGNFVWFDVTAIPEFEEDNGAVRRVCITLHDITAIKNLEDRALHQAASLSAIFENVPNVLIVVNEKGKIEQINPHGLEFLQKIPEQIEGRDGGSVFGCVNTQDGTDCGVSSACARCSIKGKITKTFATRKNQAQEEGSLTIVRDGSLTQIFFLLSTAYLDDRGKAKALISLTDITENRKKEDTLLKQKRVIELNNRIANSFLVLSKEWVADAVLDAVLKPLESEAGCFCYVFDDDKLIFPQVKKSLIINENANLIIDSAEWDGLLGQAFHNGETLVVNEELDAVCSFPHLAVSSILAVPVRHKEMPLGQLTVVNKQGGYTAYDKDLLESAVKQIAPILFHFLERERQEKEKENLAEKYRQAQKMESIGRLAGGIAHDLNNLLGPIIGYGEILLEEIPQDDSRYEPAEQIVAAGVKASNVVRQLLAFSRKQNLKFAAIALNDLIDGFEKLLRRTLRENIILDLHLSESLPLIEGDAGQLEQVIMNLAVNAQDAMPDGGRLLFVTEKVAHHQIKFLYSVAAVPGEYIHLQVSDTGYGIEDDILKNIFEPFFTTKDAFKGTGLGLATVYGIVKQHSGYITVESTIGEGTVFHIYLPVTQKTQQPCKEKSVPRDRQRLPGQGTILVVEDDGAILALSKKLLERSGYKVFTAANGHDALEKIKDYRGSLDMLLTDVIMPKMQGRELADLLSKRFPDIKVLFMSGYADDIISQHGILEEGIMLIQKPFSQKSFLAKVQEVLLS